MPPGFVLALDQGTTGSTALVVDPEGAVRARGYAEVPKHYPRPGWVEHDPQDLWTTVERASSCRARPAGLRHRRHVALVEVDPRPRARHRRQQRLAHALPEPRQRRLG